MKHIVKTSCWKNVHDVFVYSLILNFRWQYVNLIQIKRKTFINNIPWIALLRVSSNWYLRLESLQRSDPCSNLIQPPPRPCRGFSLHLKNEWRRELILTSFLRSCKITLKWYYTRFTIKSRILIIRGSTLELTFKIRRKKAWIEFFEVSICMAGNWSSGCFSSSFSRVFRVRNCLSNSLIWSLSCSPSSRAPKQQISVNL